MIDVSNDEKIDHLIEVDAALIGGGTRLAMMSLDPAADRPVFPPESVPVLVGNFQSLGDALAGSLDVRMGPIADSFSEVGGLARTYRELGERLNTLVNVGADETAGLGLTLTRINDTLARAEEAFAAATAWLDDEQLRTDAGDAIFKANLFIDRATEAAVAAGVLEARRMLPHLIAAQYTAASGRARGDLAWIAMGTQRSYVANLIPVVGDGSGAFRPVPGVINEGFVLRVTDAVAVVYRTEVHRVLVGMTSEATGRDTSVNGWSLVRWRDWYNREYLPIALAEAQDRLDVEDAADYAELERRRREREDDSRLD